MQRYYRGYRSRARTVDLTTPSVISNRTTAIPRQSEPSKERSGDASGPQAVSGLSKTEAENLLDRLEAAGYGLCQLSYVNGQGFSIRWPFGTKRTARSKA
jgi:hypothetical protein